MDNRSLRVKISGQVRNAGLYRFIPSSLPLGSGSFVAAVEKRLAVDCGKSSLTEENYLSNVSGNLALCARL